MARPVTRRWVGQLSCLAGSLISMTTGADGKDGQEERAMRSLVPKRGPSNAARRWIVSVGRVTGWAAALVVSVLLTAACRPAPPPATAPMPTSTARSQPTVALSGEAVTTSPAPAIVLFDADWDDRTPFRANLVAGEQGVLQRLSAAPVYRIDLTLADDLTSLTGRQQVRYTNAEDTTLTEVVFRLFPNLIGGAMTVSGVAVDGQSVQPTLEQSDSVLRVPLPTPLAPSGQVVIAMDFAVRVPRDPDASNYAVFGYLDDVLTLAHAYPMVAVYDDEGWNTEIAPPQGDIVYADSSFYLMRVTAPEGLVLAASGVAVEAHEEGGQQVTTFAAGPARDFYLAASPGFEVISQTVGETKVNSYSHPQSATVARQALEDAVHALHVYEQRLGPYPYTEFDVVETGTAALGVEYPGVIALANRIYTEDQSNLLEAVTAHEVAHQWFYNAVGNDQVDEPWLDESLVQYLTLLYFQDRYGRRGYYAYRESLTNRWGRVDSADIPVGLPVGAYDEQAYGAIVYGRGALFFEALAQTMGQDAFDAFLRAYYRSQRWQVATTESLKQVAEQQCGCDLTPLFQAWIYAQ